MTTDVARMRNIGISAHIDSGKTTLTERILFFSKKIHAIHEVHGKDGVGATMDSMELERERGITITSAATNISWNDYAINIIDTPGHVDFTIEVERALRVLDGAVLVLCSVGGVQSQSITVDRQLKRYEVPRIAFINKCDRVGANPYRVCAQLREKLDLNAVMMEIPIGLEGDLMGVVDLVTMKAIYFDEGKQFSPRLEEIPENLLAEAIEKRETLLDAVSMFSDELMESLMEGDHADEETIHAAIRRGTLAKELVPVYLGSAYRNTGVQPLLDAVIRYLPHPADRENKALDLSKDEETVVLSSDTKLPTVALAFKLEDGQYGQLTYVRIYQGTVKKGADLINVRNRRKTKIGRLVRMHADTMEDITEAGAGDIVALFGVDCRSGDTFVHPGLTLSMTSMYVPSPVISLSVLPKDKASSDKMSKALGRFAKEDPTFRTFVDPESNQTIIQGMGELHLEVYVERMKREYDAEVQTGQPQVAYRETISRSASFDYIHKKQTGGAGQFARVCGTMEPLDEGEYEFVDAVKGGVIPSEYIPSCNKGFQESMKKGSLIGFPVIGVKMTLNDGQHHAVDSSDMAFQAASRAAFREAFTKCSPIILEPIMKVSVEAPQEFQGSIFGSINQRRGTIISSTEEGHSSQATAEIPLCEMFGYSTVLRSLTQGKGEFTMEFLKYGKLPGSLSEELKEKFRKKQAAS